MKLENINIGLCVTGSFCTINDNIEVVKNLKENCNSLTAIFSNAVKTSTNKFSNSETRYKIFEEITGKNIIDTIEKAEPIGPKKLFDVLVVMPCTGNSLSKIANGITDTPVTMAVKAHLRNGLPLVIAISSNDALGFNAKNLGLLLNTNNVFFVPFYQDSPFDKEKSLIFKGDKLIETIQYALNKKQLQPLIVTN